MGVDRNQHLGPYVECVFKAEKRTVKHLGCANPECAEYKRKHSEKFCSTCGSPRAGFEVEEDAPPPDIGDLTREHLSQADSRAYNGRGDRTYAVANIRRKGAPTDIDLDEGTESIDLRGRGMADEIRQFEEAFAPELAKLREAFASVTVRWGFLQWYT